MTRTTLGALALAVGIGASAALAATTPAGAAETPYLGCTYPHVCFYLTGNDQMAGHPTAMYKDITIDWQILGPRSRNAYYIYNSRKDDVAYLHFADGETLCVEPQGFAYTGPQDGAPVGVDKIRISPEDTCILEQNNLATAPH